MIMGLMSDYEADAERLTRKARTIQQQAQYEMSPLRRNVKDYNTQVEGFKNSAVKVGPDELWNIVGWVGNGLAYQPVKYDNYTRDIPYAPEWSSVKHAGVGLYKGSGASGQAYAGWYNYGDSPVATIRDSTGAPIAGRTFGDLYNPSVMYASRNDQPFVAPVTSAQTASAEAADKRLTSLAAETQQRIAPLEQKAERLVEDGGLMQNRAQGAAPSAFNETQVFQSITDWLK